MIGCQRKTEIARGDEVSWTERVTGKERERERERESEKDSAREQESRGRE